MPDGDDAGIGDFLQGPVEVGGVGLPAAAPMASAAVSALEKAFHGGVSIRLLL